MTRPVAGFGASFVLLPFVVWSCSGSSGRSGHEQGSSAGQAGNSAGTGGGAGTSAVGGAGGNGSGGTTGGGGGTGGSGSGSGGKAGSGSGGGAGAQAGGAAGATIGGTSGSGGSSAGEAGGAGTAGSGGTAGSAGNAGSGGSPTACAADEDCVTAEVYVSNGCCSRRCGTALNGDYVASDPCSTIDIVTDPVPAECSAGCTQCPAADPRCPRSHGAVCVGGACKLVTDNGPCETGDDCVLGIDHLTVLGACCNCPISSSKETLAHAPCIVAPGEPKPSGCDLDPVDACASVSCPASCPEPGTNCLPNGCGS